MRAVRLRPIALLLTDKYNPQVLIFVSVVGKAAYDSATGQRTDFTIAPDLPVL